MTLSQLTVVSLALALPTGSLLAQDDKAKNVAQVLERGGRVLTGQEMADVIRGGTWHGTPNSRATLTYNQDGTFTGSVALARSSEMTGSAGVYGNWSVSESGQLCIAWRHLGGRGNEAFCRSWYVHAGEYYAGGAPADPTWRVWKQKRAK